MKIDTRERTYHYKVRFFYNYSFLTFISTLFFSVYNYKENKLLKFNLLDYYTTQYVAIHIRGENIMKKENKNAIGKKLILVGVMAVSAIGAISGCSNDDDNAQGLVSAENTAEETTNPKSELELVKEKEPKYTNGNLTAYEAYEIFKKAGLIHSEAEEVRMHNAEEFVTGLETDEVEIKEYKTHAGADETAEPSVNSYSVKNIYVYIKDRGNTDAFLKSLKDGAKK